MISAKFLSQISDRINQAKASENVGVHTVFGKVNVIFLGDLGQLAPVNAPSVFSHKLVKDLQPNTTGTMPGISALFGSAIWRMVTDVVVLKKNWRAQTDPLFINLLERIRRGIAWQGRRAKFADSPIVVSTKVVRDLLNRRLVRNYANIAGREVHDYCGLD
ncbi:hypothetical protein C8R43DRAFT_824269, partial [Mycena crocata]